MAQFINYLESALERMDEKAGDISEVLQKDLRQQQPQPPPVVSKSAIQELEAEGEFDDSLQRQRAELEEAKRAFEEQQPTPTPPPDVPVEAVRTDTPEANETTPTPTTTPPPPAQPEPQPQPQPQPPQQPDLSSLLRQEIEILTQEQKVLKKQSQHLLETLRAQEEVMADTNRRTLAQIEGLTEEKATWAVEERRLKEEVKAATDAAKGFENKVRDRDSEIQGLHSERARWVTERESGVRESAERLASLEEENRNHLAQIEVQKNTARSLEDAIAKHEADLASLHGELDSKDEELSQLNALLQVKEATVSQAAVDLDQFKARASKAVSDKDRELAALEQQLLDAQAGKLPQAAESRIPQSDEEKERLKAEVAELRAEVDGLHHKVRLAGAEKESAAGRWRQEQQELLETIERHAASERQLQASMGGVQERILGMEQQAVANRTAAEDSIREKELTIQQLEKRLAKRIEDESQSELASRCQKLSEALLEKQAAFETKNAEVEQLQMKLKTAQQKQREAELLQVSHTTVPPLKDIESQEPLDTPYQVRNSKFFQTISRRSAVGKNVTTVAASIDRLAMTTAGVLRRHVILRVVAVIYILVLHTWIFFFMGMALPNSASTGGGIDLEPHSGSGKA